MGLFGRDYDYDHGYRYGDRFGGGRSHWASSGTPIRANYDRNYIDRPGGWGSYRFGGTGGYGDDYRNRYDRPYKSQWQTDHGDPFGDREQRTPMRVIREDSSRRRGGFFSRDRYDYDQTDYPMGYRPYSARAGYDAGYNRRTFRTYGNRYDSDWF